jgi:methyl-accepting chemotaxis protein
MSPFEPFVKDNYGKCDICFETGYCTMAQCEAQKQKELEVITQIVNTAVLTAKVDRSLLNLAVPCNSTEILPQTQQMNVNIGEAMNKTLGFAISTGSTSDLMPKFENLYKNYFSDVYKVPTGDAGQVLETGTIDIVDRMIKEINDASGNLAKFVDQLAKLYDTLPEGETNKLDNAVKETEKNIESMIQKVEEVEKKIREAELNLDNATAGLDDLVKRDEIDKQMKQLKEIDQVAQQAKDVLMKNKKRVKRFR